MKSLSTRQQAILDFIKDEVREKGYPPSVREIGEQVGLASSSTVHGHLERLERKGLLRRDPTKPRAIEVLHDASSGPSVDPIQAPSIPVPIIGKVTAGQPITAIENIEEFFPLPERYASGKEEMFMLVVQGDSMMEVGIYDGDYVIVRKQESAQNGDIVVAMTADDEATVKTFYKEANHFRLQPENASLEPIILQEVSILGKVTGVFRSFE